MHEIELRFLIPPARLKGLMRQAKVKSSRVTSLAAHYFDTPKQELAKSGIGLRIRQEGDNWVQTIKAGGDGIAARLEHNALLDNEQVQAMLDEDRLLPDLTIYADTSIAPALADFNLKKLPKKLTRQYVTDVERTTRLLKDDRDKNDDDSDNNTAQSVIEVAYDYGKIIHGNDANLSMPIQEIEFELVAGEIDYLFETAKTWCKRYKLRLSTVTKAERGGLLLKQATYSPAVSANMNKLTLSEDISMPAFVRAVVHNCLLQILPNSSAIAEGSKSNDHVLQLRIGIQRLRCALKAFDRFSEQLNPEWSPILKQTATLLAEYREIAYLVDTVQPKLEQHGAPIVDWSAELEDLKVSPVDAVRANDFQLTLLELIAFTMSDASQEAKAHKLASDKLPKVLSKHYTKFLKAELKVADFEFADSNNGSTDNEKTSADEQDSYYEMQHKLRQRLKNLRYVSEFAAPLYANKKSKRWLKRVKKAQKALGEHLDNISYQQHYQYKSFTDTNALYGAGWFSATMLPTDKKSKKRLDKLQSCTVFW
ncbi:CYTH and CHAD domain-containing protein [Psychrobacter jeotgali]|uniref:CYTH and CHAD domain-containing protein n=1 Tax=Psychrobacter jeotgali TaxID=179010 RepID=UPI001917D4EA|nr:CYTH and CHAD domain-containing protein [Psychrobacter jeotgali]